MTYNGIFPISDLNTETVRRRNSYHHHKTGRVGVPYDPSKRVPRIRSKTIEKTEKFIFSPSSLMTSRSSASMSKVSLSIVMVVCLSRSRGTEHNNKHSACFTIMAPVRQLICVSYVEKSTNTFGPKMRQFF